MEEEEAHEGPQEEPGQDRSWTPRVSQGLSGGGASLAAPMILARKASAQQERTLKVVHWKHFVPDYDKYFDVFAKEFGEKNKCEVEVDYVATPDLPTAIAADISRGGGHDVFHLNGTGAWLYDNVLVDVTDIANRLAREFGGWIPGASTNAAAFAVRIANGPGSRGASLNVALHARGGSQDTCPQKGQALLELTPAG